MGVFGTAYPADPPAGYGPTLVAADVVAEQVVGEEDVTASAMNLGGLRQFDVGVAAGLSERLGSAGSEERGVGKMRAGPDPQVATVLDELVGEEKRSEEGEGPWGPLTRCVAVDVGAGRVDANSRGC